MEKASRCHIRRHCERSDLSAEALAKAEAIQNLSADAVWIASSQELLAMTWRERYLASCAPDAAQRALARCAAEPGPMHRRAARGCWVPALRSSAKRAAARPGHGRFILRHTSPKKRPGRDRGPGLRRES